MRVSSEKENSRRRGELQTIRLDNLLEDARISLGLDRVPKRIKGVKKLMSKNQTPEAVEKGILRAKHGLPVFRDGTVRFDMSDVPVTHFTPDEVGVSWSKLKHLGYSHDCFGEELTRGDQMLEIFPQDFILAKNGSEYFVLSLIHI